MVKQRDIHRGGNEALVKAGQKAKLFKALICFSGRTQLFTRRCCLTFIIYAAVGYPKSKQRVKIFNCLSAKIQVFRLAIISTKE